MKKTVILVIAAICALCLALGLAACAGGENGGASGSEGKCSEGLEFTEIKEGEEIIGYSVSKGTATDSHIFIPSTHNGLPVTEIGEAAFGNYTALTEITIPNCVKSINDYAFAGCTSLTSITIPDGITFISDGAFWGCTSLTSVTIPDSVISIGNETFYGCTSLTEVTIPDSVKEIVSCAFEDCTSLESVYITDITAWCNIRFRGKESNPLYYAHNLYLNNNLVTELTADMLQGVTHIASHAFAGCTSITEITIPNNVTVIDGSAFLECINLESITIPNSVTAIGDAFSGCTSLTEVTIPDSVKEIVSYTFRGCTSLESINIPDSVTSIGNEAFSGTAFYNNPDNWINDVLYIDDYLIEAKDTLSGSYEIRQGTKVIANQAFNDCKSLTSVIIPNSVTSIGRSAFYNCTGLTSVTIPDSVTSIGESAFALCQSLENVYFENPEGWYCTEDNFATSGTDIPSEDLQNTKTAANYFKDSLYYWHRKTA